MSSKLDDFKNSCQCHRKKRKCECKEKEVHCKVQKQLVKDCICCEWSVPEGESQVVFQTGGFKQLFGSGFVSYDSGDAPFIVVRFFANGQQSGPAIKVFEDSCVTFTYTKFDSITVTCPEDEVEYDTVDESECEGEISITSRFPV
ncbi:S-Ena type endospore appendage [Aquibacillus sediminis]|uniref:S-Ena type endospore appendage n=1 Tax=Aquibacillus sediminis TaxID=2574734 RepID=UPI0014867897|nr:S-Ena type endospore appendage [Aquibacillus sediminis]